MTLREDKSFLTFESTEYSKLTYKYYVKRTAYLSRSRSATNTNVNLTKALYLGTLQISNAFRQHQ